MIAVVPVMAPQELTSAPVNMEMVEVMMPQMPWGCAPPNASEGLPTNFKDEKPYKKYNSWTKTKKDTWATQDAWASEEWVHTPHSNAPQWVGHGHMPWMPVEHQTMQAQVPAKAQEKGRPKIQPSVTEDQDGQPIGMRMQLQALQEQDPGSVLIARKLHRLGFDSARKLQDHFSNYGAVREVLVPYSRAKASPGRRARTRPAAIGFIVMWSSEEARKALEHGNEHTIEGIEINIQAFEKRTQEEEDSQDGAHDSGETQTENSNSAESSDQEQKQSESEKTPASTTSPKARWADLSDDDDDSFIKNQLRSPIRASEYNTAKSYEDDQSPQSSQGGRWADWYEEDVSTDCSTPPERHVVPKKMCNYSEVQQNHYYQNNQQQRRQAGRGRANRGRA